MNYISWALCCFALKVMINYLCVKSGKDGTSTLSLVIHRVRLKKNLQKGELPLKGGGETQKTINFDGSWVSPCLNFFPERLHCCYLDFYCSYLYSFYNSSRTLYIKCWDSAFRTEFQHFILRFSISYWVSAFHTEI